MSKPWKKKKSLNGKSKWWFILLERMAHNSTFKTEKGQT